MFLEKCPSHRECPVFKGPASTPLSGGIFGVVMTRLILDARLPEGFSFEGGGEPVQGLLGLWLNFLPW